MPERFGMVGANIGLGDQVVSIPRDAVIIGVRQVNIGNTVLPMLTYRYPAENFADYESRAIRYFGNNETIPDEYVAVADPIAVTPMGSVFFLTRKQ